MKVKLQFNVIETAMCNDRIQIFKVLKKMYVDRVISEIKETEPGINIKNQIYFHVTDNFYED